MENKEKINVNNSEINNKEDNQKKNNGKIIILIIIVMVIIFAIGLGGGFLLANKDKNDSNNNVTTTETQESKQEQNKTSNNSKNENKVVNVVSVEDSNEMVRRQMTIEGRDINNNTVWSYTTLAENIPQEAINRGLKLIETRNGKVYLCDWGKLYILDEQTGKVLAQNIEHNIGAAAVYIFDENDNLYTTSYLAAVDKFDTNAKLLKTTDSKIWDKGFYWPKKMNLNGSNLIIDYGDEGKVTVNKDTLEIVDINKTEPNNNSKNDNTNTTNSDYAKEYIKIIDKLKEKYTDSDLKCDLIYFNNDNIPDLVIGLPGYWVSLYIYEKGTVYNPIEEWAYGAMGNIGYDYIEKKAIVSNYNSDYAGAIGTNSIIILNSNNKFDYLVKRGVGADLEPTDEMYEAVQKDLAETGGYYYNDKKISEEEYNNKLKELSIDSNTKFKNLNGSKSIEEVKKQLQQ